MNAIPTRYNGVQFRSRLEARWAAFFDLCGFKWEYEPFDCDGYIPDFLLCGKVLAEVKPVTWGDRSDAAKIHAAQDTIARAFSDGKFYWIALLGNGIYEYGGPGVSHIGKVATRELTSRPVVDRDAYGNGSSPCIDDPDLKWRWTDFGCDWFSECWCMNDGCPGGVISLESQPILSGHHPIQRPSFERFWREAGNRVQWKAPT